MPSNTPMESHGYRHQMRQPAIQIKVTFKIPEKLDIQKIDQWMAEALELNISRYKPVFLHPPACQQIVTQYLTRLIAVTTVLLQDIRVPIFEAVRIVSLKDQINDQEDCLAEIWFPSVENYPEKVIHDWLGISHRLIWDVLQNYSSPLELEKIYQDFHEKYVKVWSQKIPGARSTIPILQAAFDNGVPFSHIGHGRFVLGWGARSKIFDRSSNQSDSAIGLTSTHQKHIAIQMMRSAGLPVPNGLLFRAGSSPSLADLKTLKLPLVVKPVDRDRGEGVTLDIHTDEKLQQAIQTATQLSAYFLVEENVPGICHRILVINERVIYAVKRDPKYVVGDGHHDVKTLIHFENQRIRQKIPIKRLPEYPLDDLALEYLSGAGLKPESVLMPGQKAYLRPAQSRAWGGNPEEVTDLLHPDNATLAIRAARLFGLSCTGVDFISTDIAQPWHQNGAVINELNYAPLMGRTHPFQRNANNLYMKALFPAEGKIPIEFFVGQSALQKAFIFWKDQVKNGKKFLFFMKDQLFGPDGEHYHLTPSISAYQQLGMLRSDRSIEGLVVHLSLQAYRETAAHPFEYANLHIDED